MERFYQYRFYPIPWILNYSKASGSETKNLQSDTPFAPAVEKTLVRQRIEYLYKIFLEKTESTLHWFAGIVKQVTLTFINRVGPL